MAARGKWGPRQDFEKRETNGDDPEEKGPLVRSERGRLRNFRNKVLELPDQVGIQVLRGALTFSSGRQSSGRRWRWIDRADEERRRISHLIASIFCEIRSRIISENGVGGGSGA